VSAQQECNSQGLLCKSCQSLELPVVRGLLVTDCSDYVLGFRVEVPLQRLRWSLHACKKMGLSPTAAQSLYYAVISYSICALISRICLQITWHRFCLAYHIRLVLVCGFNSRQEGRKYFCTWHVTLVPSAASSSPDSMESEP